MTLPEIVREYYNNNSTSSYVMENAESSDITNLKVKLEDMEYKLTRLAEKLELITEKLLRLK